jgi:Carbohydrate binding module (family 6)
MTTYVARCRDRRAKATRPSSRWVSIVAVAIAAYGDPPPVLAAKGDAASDELVSNSSFQNLSFAREAGSFTATFTATPNDAPIDGVIGLSSGAADAHSDLAVTVRFNASGGIDAYNGSAYAAATAIPYGAGVAYRFRLVVSVPARRYDAYVKAPGGAELVIGTGYAFRAEQAGVTGLDDGAIHSTSGAFNLKNFGVSSTTLTSTPYGGSPRALPGTIGAASFDDGGEGEAYHDTSIGNLGDATFRNPTDVDIKSNGGTYSLGWVDTGEWLIYTVDVTASATYDFRVRAASGDADGAVLHVEVNGVNLSGPVAVPNTGSYITWTTVQAPITLAAGVQRLRVVVDEHWVDLDFFEVAAAGTPSCGDGTCNGTEICSTCPSDCGACPLSCGDDTCNGTETCSTCASDCGACPPSCGDGTCNGSETCSTCASDCGTCASTCNVPGGTSTSPTNLGSTLGNSQCTTFILGDGFYQQATITRSGITVRAQNQCAARVAPTLTIQGNNVTVDGVSVTTTGVGIGINRSGVHLLNSCVQGFGKSGWGQGIQVYQEALDPNNRIIIRGNSLTDWGGGLYSGGIAIGKANDNYNIYSTVTVEVRDNHIVGAQMPAGRMNSGIQSFHPFIATGNYIDRVEGSAVQNKTFNSHIACNEAVRITGDGALYNRLNSANVWEYNLVHDSFMGMDHFMGNDVVFRGNVFYNNQYLGRVKDQGMGTANLLFENNTFYNSTGWAGFIWDNTSGAPLSNILWRRNIFHTVNGAAIRTSASLDAVWDEYENIFYNTQAPSGTTGAGASSLLLNPQLIGPPLDFTPLAPAAAGRGAVWPLPCP